MNRRSDAPTFKNRIEGTALYTLSQIVRRTCKFDITHEDRLMAAVESGNPVIMTGWHGITTMAVPLIQRFHPNLSNFVALMPDDWRGATLGIWAAKMGVVTYPMKLTGDSTMGTARQVVKLTRNLMSGKCLFINPDGPDGPSHIMKPGIIYIARKANAPIIPIGAYCRRAYHIHRWDRYVIPLPFSRIRYHIGEPIEKLPDDDTSATELVTNSINRVTLQAAADYYEID